MAISKRIYKTKPTALQKRAIKIVAESGGKKSLGEAMVEAGYSEETARQPKKLTESQAWHDLMEKHLPDEELSKVHKQLLKSKMIEHMVFPTATSDEDIKELLTSVGCTVRKIQRGDQAIHVWFWCANSKARQSALDMAYKLKGRYQNKPLIDNSKHYHYDLRNVTDEEQPIGNRIKDFASKLSEKNRG